MIKALVSVSVLKKSCFFVYFFDSKYLTISCRALPLCEILFLTSLSNSANVWSKPSGWKIGYPKLSPLGGTILPYYNIRSVEIKFFTRHLPTNRTGSESGVA